MSLSSEENDHNGNTPPEVEQLLGPRAGAVSGEDMGRQESRSERDGEEKEMEVEEKREGGGDAFVAAGTGVAADLLKSMGGASVSAGRKRGKDGRAIGAGNAAAMETIQKLLLMIPVDLEKLRNMAWEKGGYQTDELRMKAWPKLLGLDRHRLEDFRQHLETPHPMSEQIQRDIDRSLTHFVQVRKWKRQRQQSKRDKLRDVINAIVRKYDGVLNYFQGYHDVVAMLLLTTGDTQLTYAITERVSHYFFRDSMRADFSVLTYLMHLLPVIMHEFDPELAAFVSKCKVEPYYCMAWVLTWFAHDLHDLPTVARLYDVLLGAHPTLIFYICAAVVISARKDVLECECEFAAAHGALSQSARGVQDWEAVLHTAKRMFLKCPPRELVQRAPAYIKETLVAGGVTALEFPPPWFTGTSLPDWILLEQSREKKGKKRIGKAAKHWRRAARLAGAENPDEMLAAYLDGKRQGYPRRFLKKLASVRFRPSKWKVHPSPATLFSTAVLVGAVSYTYHVSSRH